MPKYRVVYAFSVDVEAKDEIEAREQAINHLLDIFSESVVDAILENFGENIEEIEENCKTMYSEGKTYV